MSGIQLMQQGPPPKVVFEQRAVEDREATIAAKKLVLKDLDYAIIYRSGSKDYVEKIATEWLDECDRQAREGQWPADWAVQHRQQYEQFRSGQEVTPIGFPIKHWAMATAAQVQNLLNARVFTVEDMAGASEEVLARIGMGGRLLKERAQAWLQSQKGNVGEELVSLRAQLANLTTRLDSETEKRKELEAALTEARAGRPVPEVAPIAPKRRGRPAKATKATSEAA